MTTVASLDAGERASLCGRIDELADRVGALWHGAAADGDFGELERCTSASQALRRASVALRGDALIGD